MNNSKKSKVKFNRKKTFAILMIFVLFILFLLVKNLFVSKNVYKKKVHVKDVSSSIEKNDTDEYETIGWIDVDGTNINMPIYLAKNDNANYSVVKEKFGWTENSSGKLDNFMIIFGHNIMNLGIPKTEDNDFNRFEELMGYVYLDFAKEHKYFQYTTGGEEYVYKIFSVSIVTASEMEFLPKKNIKKSDLSSYIEGFSKASIYKYDLDVDSDDKIMILSTCTRMFGYSAGYYDIAVAGRLVRDGEDYSDYSLEKTSKYKKVDKVLKGDEKDDSSEA